MGDLIGSDAAARRQSLSDLEPVTSSMPGADIGEAVDSVAHIIQVALTPVFLLSGIGALLNVFNTRLSRVSDHREHVEDLLRGEPDGHGPIVAAPPPGTVIPPDPGFGCLDRSYGHRWRIHLRRRVRPFPREHAGHRDCLLAVRPVRIGARLHSVCAGRIRG